ncbi:hypothetical protein MT391_10630, partial [Vibrio sp. 1-Bac 57]
MIFLQRTFTSLVHAHAGRTQANQAGQKTACCFVPQHFSKLFFASYWGVEAVEFLQKERLSLFFQLC